MSHNQAPNVHLQIGGNQVECSVGVCCQIPRLLLSAVCSVNFLHLGGLIGSAFNLLQRRQVIIIAKSLIIVVDAKTKLDHTMNAASKLGWLIKVETRGQERGVEQEPNQVLDCLVRLV